MEAKGPFPEKDILFMREALREARKAEGRTSPNPMVGALLVKGDSVLARGYHHRAGMPHAEVEALRQVPGETKGATLYVTLEPCNHHGRTPPCTEAILESEVARVVIGMGDPNPHVRGGGADWLEAKGIAVTRGVLEAECRRCNEAFLTFVTEGRPFVTLKSALTLDGFTATSTGHSRWITGERARRRVHRLRSRTDAILVGIGTVLADDPLLTVRLGRRGDRNPLRVILDTHGRIPLSSKIVGSAKDVPTLLVVGEGFVGEVRRPLEEAGLEILDCPSGEGGLDPGALLRSLGQKGMMTLLIEGGAGVVGSFLRQGFVDKFMLFLAPKLLGGDDGTPMARGPGPRIMDDCLSLQGVLVRRYGVDLLVEGYPVRAGV